MAESYTQGTQVHPQENLSAVLWGALGCPNQTTEFFLFSVEAEWTVEVCRVSHFQVNGCVVVCHTMNENTKLATYVFLLHGLDTYIHQKDGNAHFGRNIYLDKNMLFFMFFSNYKWII